MVLEEYRDILGRMAGSVGVCFLLIPAGICLQIIRQRSTENIDPAHFIIGGCITLLKMRHGQLLNAPHMVTSTGIAFCLCMCYLSVYAFYSDNRKAIGQLLLKFIVVPVLLITYSLLDDLSRAEKVYGTAVSCLMFGLMSFPLFKIKQIIKQKHTGDLSLAMCLFGSLQSVLWLLYALSLGNYIEMVSRLVFFLMVLPQLALFCIYPMPKTTKKKDEIKSH